MDWSITYLLQGRFTIAAKHHINIAEIYETEMADLDKVSIKSTSMIIPLQVVFYV